MNDKLNEILSQLLEFETFAKEYEYSGFAQDFKEVRHNIEYLIFANEICGLTMELENLLGSEDLQYKLEDLIHDFKMNKRDK